MKNKDLEFENILSELSFKDENLDFKKMRDLLNKIKEISSSEDSFNINIELIAGLLYKLSPYVFRINHEMRKLYDNYPLMGHIPGSHDYNRCLSVDCFDYKIYKDFYQKFCEDIEVFVISKGLKYPRILHELEYLRPKKLYPDKWYKIKTLIFISKYDLPQDKFDINDMFFAIKGRYYVYHENIFSEKEYIEKQKALIDKLGKDWNEYKKYYEKYINTDYLVEKEISNNKDYYLNLPPFDTKIKH